MTFIIRNFKTLFTLVLIVCSHRTVSTHELHLHQSDDGGYLPNVNANASTAATRNGTSRTISINTNNLNNLLNKNPLQTINDGVNAPGIVSSINAIKTDLDNLSQQFNIFKFIDIFINQSRQSIPLMVTKGNFTLLQAALLCAVGSMAAGAAIIVAEAFYFKKIKEQEYYHDLYEKHYSSKLPSLTYGQKSGLERSDEDGAGIPHAREMQQQQQQRKRSPSASAGPSTMSPQKLAEYYERELKRMNKPQSLKRSQRRRQRKNKNSAGLANNIHVLSEGLGGGGGGRGTKRSPTTITRTKRQTQTRRPASAASPQFNNRDYRPNSFNQYLNNPELSRTDNGDFNNTSETVSLEAPAFSGPRGPQDPLQLPPVSAPVPQEQYAPQRPPPAATSNISSKFDFVNIFKKAMNVFLNYLFDQNGGYSTNLGPLSRNDFMQQPQQSQPPMQQQGQGSSIFRFPKLKPNRNFIPNAGRSFTLQW